MSSDLRGPIVTSLVVQGLGSLSPILTILVLARLAGPQTQGEFSTFKTWADLVSSLFVFGFPQAFVYVLNKGMASRAHLLNLSLLYGALSAVVVVPLAAYSVVSGYNHLPDGRGLLLYSGMLALGMSALVVNRLVRSIYLTLDDGFMFSLVTSAPAFFLLLTIAAASLFTPFQYDLAFLIAGALTLLATAVWIQRIIAATTDYSFRLPRLPRRVLAVQSGQVFLQSVSFTLQPVVTIYLITAFGGRVTDVAFFTSATIVISAVNVFFGIISPVLFNRWSTDLDAALLANIQKLSDWLAVGFLVIGVIALPLYGILVPLVFGSDYLAAVPAFQLASLALAPVAFTRTVTSVIHAAGRPGVNTISCALRLAASVAAQVALVRFGAMPPLLAAVAAWAIAEWVAAAYSRQAGRRILTWY